MVCAPVRSIIPSLKLGDYLSVQAHKSCSISHLVTIQDFVLANQNKSLSIFESLEAISSVVACIQIAICAAQNWN